MTQFDWKTDEENGWERPPQLPPEQEGGGGALRRLLRRRWRPLSALLLVIGAATLLTVRGLALRLAAVEAATLADVRMAHEVLLAAAAEGDEELYLSLLGGSRSWRQRQLAALEQDVLYERRALGLIWQKDAETDEEIVLSPDLQQAVVTGTLRYEELPDNGSQETILLRHHFRYERSGSRWLLSPPQESMWNGWVTFEEEPDRDLAIIPRRDEEIGKRLSNEIVLIVRRLCDGLITCSEQTSVEIRFSTGSELLASPRLWVNAARRNAYGLDLPTPSLVGAPAGEADFRALRAAYLRVTARLFYDSIARGVGGASMALHDARYRAILAELDLMAWPPQIEEAAGTVAIAGDVLTMCSDIPNAGASLWRYDADAGRWRAELSGRNLLQMAALNGVPGVLLREQHERQRRTTEPQPDLVWWGEGQELALFENYYLGTVFPSSPMFTAANTDGQLHWINLGAAGNCNGRRCSGIQVHERAVVWSPDGQHTLFWRELEGSRSPPASDGVLWLGDANGEALTRLEEGTHPFWIDDETLGYLATPEEGAQPFPSNYELVIRRLQGDGVSGARRLHVAVLSELRAPGSDDQDVLEMGVALNQVFVHPSRPQTVFLVGGRYTDLLSSVALPELRTYIFAVDLASEEVTVRVPNADVERIILPRISPDGRWLAYLSGTSVGQNENVRMLPNGNWLVYQEGMGEGGEGTLAVHDLTAEPGQASVYETPFDPGSSSFSGLADGSTPYDWSQQSGQFLYIENGVVTVVDPQQWRARRLIPPTAGCAHAAWAD